MVSDTAEVPAQEALIRRIVREEMNAILPNTPLRELGLARKVLRAALKAVEEDIEAARGASPAPKWESVEEAWPGDEPPKG